MKNFNNDNLIAAFKELFSEFGLLKFFNVTVNEGYEPCTAYLYLSKKLDINPLVTDNASKFIDTNYMPLYELIDNSDYVKRKIYYYENQCSTLEKSLAEMKEKVTELEKYKVHYDLALKLAHGNKVD